MLLILIDGLPGSGKSTMAANLGKALGARVVMETEPDHPLHPIPTDAMGAAWADIHLKVSPEEFASQSLERWSQFLAKPWGDSPVVIESFPFQSAIRVLLQMEAPSEAIHSYWQAWAKLAAPHRPVLIYLHADDINRLLTEITSHRGPRWTQYVLDAFGQMPYAASRGLSGWDAARMLLTDYASLINQLIDTELLNTRLLEGRPSDYKVRFEAALHTVQTTMTC